MIALRMKRNATTKHEGLWVVLVEGREVGFLTRFANSRTETHPWKAFAGIGPEARFLGAFYDGLAAAITTVVAG